MLILINRCLLNVVFSMTKALNGQSSPEQNSILCTFQCYLESPAWFPVFRTPFFYFKLYKISTAQTPVWTVWLI